MTVYDKNQYKVKKFMKKPKKVEMVKQVNAPMPGSIVSIHVKPGDQVLEGQEIYVIEAMKMKNVIKSTGEGKIKKICVKPGEAVKVNQLLLEFE